MNMSKTRWNLKRRINSIENIIWNLLISSNRTVNDTSLQKIFHEHFGENMPHKDFDHSSIVSFLSSLSDILEVCGDDSSSVISPRSSQKSQRIETAVESQKTKVSSASDSDSDIENTDTGRSDTENRPDVVLSEEEIPRQWINDIKHDNVPIQVGQMFDPSVFWIILNTDECSKALAALTDRLQCVYTTPDVRYQISRDRIAEGLVCASFILNKWHRGVIVYIVDDSYVKIFYFDYGAVEVVSILNLRYLAGEFKYLPQQAIRARLINLVPFYNDFWSDRACETFLHLIVNKSLQASFVQVDVQMGVLNTVLVDMNGERNIVINEYLCRNKLATLNISDKIPTNFIFSALNHSYIERGNLPTYFERRFVRSLGFSARSLFGKCLRTMRENPSYKFNIDIFRSIAANREQNAQREAVAHTSPVYAPNSLPGCSATSDSNLSVCENFLPIYDYNPRMYNPRLISYDSVPATYSNYPQCPRSTYSQYPNSTYVVYPQVDYQITNTSPYIDLSMNVPYNYPSGSNDIQNTFHTNGNPSESSKPNNVTVDRSEQNRSCIDEEDVCKSEENNDYVE